MLQFSAHHTVMRVLYLDHLLYCSCFLCTLFVNSVYQSGLSLLQGCLQSSIFNGIHCMCCYSSIQYLCEPCQAITARALPPESPYCLRPPTRLPPRRRLLSLILRSCLLREPSAPEAKVAAAKAPEAVNVQRGGKKTKKKTHKKHKGQRSPCLFLLSQPAVLVSSCGATCCRWRAASHVRMHGRHERFY